jgi:YfiH family protein
MIVNKAELKKWQKKIKSKKEWYEFFFNSRVRVFQGTKYFNPLCEIKGEFIDLIQIHSSVIHKARNDIKLVGDGFFTNQKGFNLFIRTADCLPMIFYHPGKEILALLHVGWKGTALKIAKEFLFKMKELYNLKFKDWEVSLGPCIAPGNYEVGKGVFEFFNKFNIDGIKIKNRQYFLDLEEANIEIIKKYGVSKIYPFPEKTYTSELFYSSRKGDTERNITAGVIEY